MKTLHQVVEVKGDRKIEITLPNTVEPGLVEMVIVLQPMSPVQPTKLVSQSINLFGFLPQRVDPLQFQQQLRNEWNR